MEPATKQDVRELEKRVDEKFARQTESIGGMFAEQTKMLLEHLDGMKTEIKHDIMDLRGDTIAETKRQIAEHVTVQHAVK